eukprot:tig00000692_g3260.t1
MSVYFVQGVLGLARLAISFFLKDELSLSPAAVGALTGVAMLPWLIKPLYGFISDAFPLFGYRRRSYLLLAGLAGSCAWLALSTVVSDPASATAACFVASMSVAVADVVVDSLVVEKARGEEPGLAGSLQSLCWGSSAVGGLLSAYFSGSLIEALGTRGVFAAAAVFPLLTASVSTLLQEARAAPDRPDGLAPVLEQVRLLKEAVTQRAVWLPTLFLFIWQASANSDAAWFFYLTNELGFRPEFLGRVRLFTSAGALVGVALYNRWFRTVPLRTIFFWSTLASAPLGLTSLVLVYHLNRAFGIPDELFAMGDSVVLTVLGQISFMPVLVLAARLCPPGVEASLFALLMSCINGASTVGTELGALLTSLLGVTESDFSNLPLLLLICNLSSWIPLPFISWLPAESSAEAASAAELERAKGVLPPPDDPEHHM